MLILSPRAVERLETYEPAWPLPKIFRMTTGGKLIEGIFEGETINTPSMLCVEDYLDALRLGASDRRAGGADRARRRQSRRRRPIGSRGRPGSDFLAADPATRSNTSVCLKIVDPGSPRCDADAQAAFAKGFGPARGGRRRAMTSAAYRDAPPGLRIWCGATVETADIEALMPWLDWAFARRRRRSASAA